MADITVAMASEVSEHGKKMQNVRVIGGCVPDGATLEARDVMLPGGEFLTVYTDVNDRKRIWEATQSARDLIRQAIENSSTYIWETDASGRFTFVLGATRFLGFDTEEMLGHSMADFMAVDAIGQHEDTELSRAIAARQPYSELQMHFLAEDGESVWVSSSGHPVADAQGRFSGYRGIDVNVTKLIQARAEQERLALRDPLTGLANRRHLMEQFAHQTSRHKRSGKLFAMLVLDVDRFKTVNDRYGHLAGDDCLRSIAATVESCLRTSDIASRFGGEEFVVLLPETDMQGARLVAEKLRDAVHSLTISVPAGTVRLTVSIGIATARPGEPADFDPMFSTADKAMYLAKRLGRNQVCTPEDSPPSEFTAPLFP